VLQLLYIVGIENAADHLLHNISRIRLDQYRKAVFLIIITMFGWTHFAIQYDACCIYVLS